MAAEPLTIVTLRLTDRDKAAGPPVPGSMEGACHSCREPVNLSPNSIAEIRRARGGAVVKCSVCVFAELARMDPETGVDVRHDGDMSKLSVTARELAEGIDELGLST